MTTCCMLFQRKTFPALFKHHDIDHVDALPLLTIASDVYAFDTSKKCTK